MQLSMQNFSLSEPQHSYHNAYSQTRYNKGVIHNSSFVLVLANVVISIPCPIRCQRVPSSAPLEIDAMNQRLIRMARGKASNSIEQRRPLGQHHNCHKVRFSTSTDKSSQSHLRSRSWKDLCLPRSRSQRKHCCKNQSRDGDGGKSRSVCFLNVEQSHRQQYHSNNEQNDYEPGGIFDSTRSMQVGEDVVRACTSCLRFLNIQEMGGFFFFWKSLVPLR